MTEPQSAQTPTDELMQEIVESNGALEMAGRETHVPLREAENVIYCCKGWRK